MTSPDGLLHFFVLEATDYIDRLDSLVTSAGEDGPDASAFGRYARNLRGSATMSRQMGIAELASALERLARALRNRAVKWDAAVNGVVSLCHRRSAHPRTRRSAPPAPMRAHAFAPASKSSDKLAPASVTAFGTPSQSQPSGAMTFLAGESAELARALDHLVSSPEDDSRSRASSRARARDSRRRRAEGHSRTRRSRRSRREHAQDARAQCRAGADDEAEDAAHRLRRDPPSIARDIASRGRASDDIPELASFKAALAAVEPEAGRGDRIVPIAQLFHDDEGPHILTTAPQPPTTAAERFRLEVVSLAEHLRGVVAQARANRAPEQRERNQRELRSALRALGSAANSFGEKQVARFSAEWSVRVATLNDAQMEALDRAAELLANPSTRHEEVARGLERLAAPRAPQPGVRTPTPLGDADVAAILRTPTPIAAIPVTRAQTPRTQPAVPAAPAPAAAAKQAAPPAEPPRQPATRTPTGRDLHDYLQTGSRDSARSRRSRSAPPSTFPTRPSCPSRSLLYSGKAALERARELKAEMLAERALHRVR